MDNGSSESRPRDRGNNSPALPPNLAPGSRRGSPSWSIGVTAPTSPQLDASDTISPCQLTEDVILDDSPLIELGSLASNLPEVEVNLEVGECLLDLDEEDNAESSTKLPEVCRHRAAEDTLPAQRPNNVDQHETSPAFEPSNFMSKKKENMNGGGKMHAERDGAVEGD